MITNTPSFREILCTHAARYPGWQPQDVYKLCHQAALGSEHAFTDREQARARLARELAALASPAPAGLPAEPLVDPISADGGIARVHLRTLARQRLPTDILLDAFLRTAAEFQGSRETLQEYLQDAARLKSEGILDFSVRQLSGFFMEMARNNFPAAHHSKEYARTYCPAYRVVARAFLPVEYRDQ